MNYAILQIGDVTVLDLRGRMSVRELGPQRIALHDLVREQMKDGQPKKILLNLSEVTYIDSSGVGELVSSLITVRNRSGQLRICNASGRVVDLLRVTRLDSVLNFDKDERTALQAFSGEGK